MALACLERWYSVGLREASRAMLFDCTDHSCRCWTPAPQQGLAARRAEPACGSGVGVSSQKQDDDQIESAIPDRSLNGIRSGVGFAGGLPFKLGRGKRIPQSLHLLTSTITPDDQDATIHHRGRDSTRRREPLDS